MKQRAARCVVLLGVVACATVAGVVAWPTARYVRTEDQNSDGRPDIWRRYDDRGQLTELFIDSNFDGSPDVEESYEQGILVRRTIDRDFNGQVDLVEEFDAETHGQTRLVVDIDYDGTADLLVLFRDGQPVFTERTRSPQRSGALTSRSPSLHQQGASQLAPLADPFEAETALRPVRTASHTKGFLGLSTSGGLPCPRATTLGGMFPSAPLVVRETQHHVLALLRQHSPRAPPVSRF